MYAIQFSLIDSFRYDIKDVKAISKFVGTRTPTQVRTHAQKWLLKQVRKTKTDRLFGSLSEVYVLSLRLNSCGATFLTFS